MAYYQREEIAAAIALARTGSSHRVVPVYLNSEAALSDYIPYGLRLKHGITLSDAVGVEELCKELFKLRADLQEGRAPDARKPPASNLSMAVGVDGYGVYNVTLRSASSIQIRPAHYMELLDDGSPRSTKFASSFFEDYDYLPNLDFKVVNNGHRTLFLTEVCFEIISSQLDPRPLLVVEEDDYGLNALHFRIWNEGWGPVRNLQARFHLMPVGANNEALDNHEPYPHEILVGDFCESTNVDIAFAFREAGVDLEGLYSLGRLFNEDYILAREKFLGEFKSNSGIVTGELGYELLSLEGQIAYHRVKFSTIVHTISGVAPDGAPAPPSFQYNVKLEVDCRDYQRRVQISHVLKPGEADRFNIKVRMEKSSLHSFIAKLIYNDGYELSSPLVELLGWIPRSVAHALAWQERWGRLALRNGVGEGRKNGRL